MAAGAAAATSSTLVSAAAAVSGTTASATGAAGGVSLGLVQDEQRILTSGGLNLGLNWGGNSGDLLSGSWGSSLGHGSGWGSLLDWGNSSLSNGSGWGGNGLRGSSDWGGLSNWCNSGLGDGSSWGSDLRDSSLDGLGSLLGLGLSDWGSLSGNS